MSNPHEKVAYAALAVSAVCFVGVAIADTVGEVSLTKDKLSQVGLGVGGILLLAAAAIGYVGYREANQPSEVTESLISSSAAMYSNKGVPAQTIEHKTAENHC